MILRVNRRHHSRDAYLKLLSAAGINATPCVYSVDGIVLEAATNVRSLPGFGEGRISVQDEAAQLDADLLDLAPVSAARGSDLDQFGVVEAVVSAFLREQLAAMGLYQPASASRHKSPSTAPASTEASWSLSPSNTKRAWGGKASSKLAIISRSIIEASSTTSTSSGNGLPR